MTLIGGEQTIGQSGQFVGSSAAFAAPKTAAPPLDGAVAKALGGIDVIEARRALRTLTADQRVLAFATPIGDKLLVPVLDAARRGAPHMLALFEGMGACLGVETPRGLNAVHVALDYYQLETARTLLGNPALRERLVDERRVSISAVANVLATLPNATDDELDKVTLMLTACDPENLRNVGVLGIYHAHVFDLDKTPAVPKAEGWNPESSLEQRIRSLVGWFAQTFRSNTDQRASIVNEIATTLEALHLNRRTWAAANINDALLTRAALEHECEGIIRKLRAAIESGNVERTHLLIPITTPKHQMYLELEPVYIDGKHGILMHFDNLGEGNGAHTTKENRIFPIRTAVLATPESFALVKTLCIEMLSQRASGTTEGVYQALYRWMTAITVANGVDAVEDPELFEIEKTAEKQRVGNCTIANIRPGTSRRMGVFADAFHTFEQVDARRRCAEAGSVKSLMAAEQAGAR